MLRAANAAANASSNQLNAAATAKENILDPLVVYRTPLRKPTTIEGKQKKVHTHTFNGGSNQYVAGKQTPINARPKGLRDITNQTPAAPGPSKLLAVVGNKPSRKPLQDVSAIKSAVLQSQPRIENAINNSRRKEELKKSSKKQNLVISSKPAAQTQLPQMMNSLTVSDLVSLPLGSTTTTDISTLPKSSLTVGENSEDVEYMPPKPVNDELAWDDADQWTVDWNAIDMLVANDSIKKSREIISPIDDESVLSLAIDETDPWHEFMGSHSGPFEIEI